MSDTRFSARRLCPNCGAAVEAGAKRCFLCFVRLGPPPYASAQLEEFTVPELQRPSRLPDILILIVVFLIFGGLASLITGIQAPLGLLILFGLILTPILVYSWTSRRQRVESPYSIRSIITILAVVLTCGVAGFVAFFVTCWVGCFAGSLVGGDVGPGMITGFVLGPLCGIVVAIWLGRRLLGY